MAKFVVWLLSFMFFCALVAVAGVLFVIFHYEKDLPDYLQLSDYQPAVTTRLYAGNGNLLAEYAAEKRIFVPVSRMPPHILEAFISAEDKHFYSHGGLDYTGIARAVLVNIKNHGKGRRMVGASTITQQVAKNFLLTNEVSFDRKIKEALIAFRMERTFTKEHILELYLNEIYLGKSSYGVAAAALNYFNKSLDELTLGEKIGRAHV
jgi:penicillin-binding protein 1A